MNQKEMRRRQRFANFKRAYTLLETYHARENPDELERAGLIHFFEIAFELSWKLMKDYLEAQGYQIRSPKDAIKQALQYGLIADGQAWLEALEDRNLTVHTYDEATALALEKEINDAYFSIMHDFFEVMQEKAAHEIRSE